MNYTKEIGQDKKIKFTIDITSSEWEEMLNHVYEHQKSKYKVEGFRVGKAPRKVIEKQYGESVFYNDALNECFYHYFEDILAKEKDVELVGNPSLDVSKLDNTGVTLVVKSDVKPEIKLGQYKGLNVQKDKVEVLDKEVDEEIQKMVEKSARLVVVDRPVKLSDTAVIDFTGYCDGKAFDGGHAEHFELEIGSGKFIAGFEEQIVGMKAGEEKDINVTFPENYPVEALKGKPSVFKIKLNEVREKQVPQLDDKFAQNVSEFDTLSEYRESVKKDILSHKEAKNDFDFEEKLINAVSDKTEVEIPQSMIDEQVDMFIHDFENRLAQQGLKLEDYVKYMGTTVEELKKSRLDDAKKTCKTRLTLEAIIKQENIKVENDDMQKEIERRASAVSQSVEDYKKQLNEHLLSHIANDLLVEKLIKFLKENN